MKKLWLFLILFAIPMVGFAQGARDIQITVSYDAPVAGEQITNYQCNYVITESGIIQQPVTCDFPITNPVIPHVITILTATGDSIKVDMKACNVNGCSTVVSTTNEVIPPAVDPASAPTGVSATVIKI